MAKYLFLITGAAGSGKSTLATKIQNLSKTYLDRPVMDICEADDFWYILGKGEYAFDPKMLWRAHRWCQGEAEKHMQKGESIIVSNTSLTPKDRKPYFDLADKHGYVKVIVPSLILFSMTFLLFSLAKSIVLIIAAAVVAALGYGMAQPSIQALCMKMVPRDRSGVGANTMFFMQDIGQFLGPTIAGAVVDMFLRSGMTDVNAYASSYRFMMIPLIAAAVIAFLLRNVYKKNIKNSK